MQIEFRCSNQETDLMGQPNNCNQLLKADSQYIGKQVRCPKCEKLTTIPSQSVADSYNDQQAPSGAQPGRSPSQSASPSGQTSGPQLKVGKFDPFVRCPECGSMLDAKKRCTKCKYFQRRSESDDLPLKEMDVKPAGFILFLRKKLARDLGAGVITSVCFVMVFLTCFVLLSCSLCSLGYWGFIIIPVLMALIVVSAIVYLKIRELCTVPGSGLAFWQKPLWDMVLSTVRGTDWSSKFVEKGSKVVDLRSNPPSDQDLFMLPDLPKCRVLDLEGAPISDAGLTALRSLPNLRYLVLKNTDVTSEGVFRLQQSIPEAWIWS